MKQFIISAAIVLLVTIVAVTWFLAPDSLMNCGQTPDDSQGCGKADAIIAVSGGDTTARTQTAIDLYKRGWAPKLIFSGAAADKTGPSNAKVMRDQAVKQGVAPGAISIEDTSENTRENAEHTQKLLDTLKVNSAIVVSSQYHQKRVMLEFKAYAPTVQFRSHPATTDNQWSMWWWVTPHGWFLAVSEVTKIIVFYAEGAGA